MKTAGVDLNQWAIKDTDWVAIANKPMEPVYRYLVKRENPVRAFTHLHKQEISKTYKPYVEEYGTGLIVLLNTDNSPADEEKPVVISFFSAKGCESLLNEPRIAAVKQQLGISLKTALAHFEWPTSVPVLALTNREIYCFLEDFSPNPNTSRRFGK